MTRLARHVAVVAALALPLTASAQLKPEEAIRARQSIMRVMALNFGAIGKMGSGDAAFDNGVFLTNAARVESIWAMNPGQYFVPGTEKPVAGAKIATFTDAKPEIWSQPDAFKAAAARATEEIRSLATAARAGDEKAMRSAAGDVGKSCKGCHDQFRAK